MREKYIDAMIMISIALLLLIAVTMQIHSKQKVKVITVQHDSIQKVIEARVDTIVKTRVTSSDGCGEDGISAER